MSRLLRTPLRLIALAILFVGVSVTCAGAVVVWCARWVFPEDK